MSITVTLSKISNNGPKQEAIAEKACELLGYTLNHPKFRPAIEGMNYEETRFQKASGEEIEVPVDEIYDFLVLGNETEAPHDEAIGIEVSLKCFKEGVLGSTALRSSPFFTSYWFINSCIENKDPVSLAAHFMHEWLHVVGFYHFPGNEARNDVAYNVGNAVQKLLLEEPELIAKSYPELDATPGASGSELLTPQDCLQSGCGQCGGIPNDLSVAEEDDLKM